MTATGRFSSDIVLITGAAGHIGAECVAAYERDGASVVAVDLEPVGVASDHVLEVAADLTDPDAFERILDAAEERFGGPPTIVVQSAAAFGRMPYLELTADNIDRVFAINVRATLLLGAAAARRMVAHGVHGAIVNLTSISGEISHGESVAYEASKGAVTMATKAMANALSPHGIRVNAVGPGVLVKSQERDAIRDPHDLSDFERQRIPLRRFGTPAEITKLIQFVSSPDASYMTGSIVYADGGVLGAWTSYEP